MKKSVFTKLSAVALAALMFLPAFAGCGQKPKTDLPTPQPGLSQNEGVQLPNLSADNAQSPSHTEGTTTKGDVIPEVLGGVNSLDDWRAEQKPLEDAASSAEIPTVDGMPIKDADGALLVPFDRAYPEAFASGAYEYNKEHALLKLDGDSATLSKELRACGFIGLEKSVSTEKGTWYRATVSGTADVVTAVAEARLLDSVLVADFDYVYRAEAVNAIPDTDENNALLDKVLENAQVTDQWHLTSSAIQRAWRFLEANGSQAGGSSSVVIAVIDTGVDYNHPDLKANMWINTGEIPDNGIDDDNNGYVDDVYGIDAIAGTGDPMDDHGHGTHVAGIAAASNNKEGIVGVAYNAKIMAVKAGQATGVFYQSDIAEAILYAYEMGADVINMSFGGSACSIPTQDALSTAYTRSTLVASAGNNGMPNEVTDYYPIPLPNYPAALSYVVGVMSVNPFGVESGFTNWDAKAFNTIEYEVYAPGEAILSTLPDGRYAQLSGTSMSAPVVAGVAALLRSYYTDRDMYPSKFIAAQLCATSEDEAICCNPKRHTVNGLPHNLPMCLDAYAALTKLPKPDVSLYDYYLFDDASLAEGNNGDGVIDAGETVNIGAILRNRWGMSKDTVVTIDAMSSLGVANPYVEILTATSNFEGVGTYSTKDQLIRTEDKIVVGTEEPLVVKIADNCPNDYIIQLNVTVTCQNALDEGDTATYQTEGIIEFGVRNGVLLPSQIHEDMTLTKDNYYIIPYSVYIHKGVTVSVEPGTYIQFWTDEPHDSYAEEGIAMINVAGSFIVNGMLEEPVRIFPSELMSHYRVEIGTQNGDAFSWALANEKGTVELNYCYITNPYIEATTVNHCVLNQNYVQNYAYKRVEEGGQLIQSLTTGHVFANAVNQSVFYKVGNAMGEWNDNYFMGFFIDAPCNGCIFTDSNICFTDGAVPSGNGLGTIRASYSSFENCVFMGNKIVSEEGHINASTLTLRRSPFVGNAILNQLNEGNLKYWLKISGGKADGENTFMDISGNYWGTTDLKLIERQIWDFDDLSTLTDLRADSVLQEAPSNTFPFVTDAYLLNKDGDRVFTVSNETVTFVVEFNRDMDTTVPLRVRFGSSQPYGEYEIEGAYVSARRWEGTYTLKTTIENGNQYLNIENGRAADDHFLALYESPARFMFELDTTAAQAMIMQGSATETGIQLSWTQDDFDTLAGYNIYRSDREDGFYQRLNSSVLPVDVKEFFDDTVEPGKVYYYNFTVVQTDLTESLPSGKIVIMSMDTMAPNIYHSPVHTGYTGSALIVNATVTDNLMIKSATLFYRTVGEATWKSVSMTAHNDRYSGIIPAEHLSTAGLEYYIVATDGISETRKGSTDAPYAVTIKLAVDKNSYGDVDGNGVIEIKDALMLLQAANDRLNLTEDQFLRADINEDGTLSASEALTILQYVSGKITSIHM